MDKYTQMQAVHDAIEEGVHTSNPQEELVWREIAAVYGDNTLLEEAIAAVNRLEKAAQFADRVLRKLL